MAPDGKDLIEASAAIPGIAKAEMGMNVRVEGKTLLVQLPKSDMARVAVMDMQGRVVSKFDVSSGATQIPLNLNRGNYVVLVKQGSSSWVRNIRLAE